jgi:hypothetical protein
VTGLRGETAGRRAFVVGTLGAGSSFGGVAGAATVGDGPGIDKGTAMRCRSCERACVGAAGAGGGVTGDTAPCGAFPAHSAGNPNTRHG